MNTPSTWHEQIQKLIDRKGLESALRDPELVSLKKCLQKIHVLKIELPGEAAAVSEPAVQFS